VGVCEEYDSMGVRNKVDPSTSLRASGRPFDYAQGGRGGRLERVGVSSDAGTGAGLKVGFNTENTECAESRSRSLASEFPSRLPSFLRASRVDRAGSVNRVKGTGEIGPSRLASKLSVKRVNAKHGGW
jgi:hypothetical protein